MAPQEIAPTLDETEPEPFPVLLTVKVNVCSVKFALTVVAAVTEVTQVPVPEQPPPDHPVKVDPVDGVAVKVTEVP